MGTYYDTWLRAEKQRIRNEFKQKKELLLLKSLDAGFNEDKAALENISSEYARLDAQEQELINQFESDPAGATAKFMKYVRANQTEGK